MRLSECERRRDVDVDARVAVRSRSMWTCTKRRMLDPTQMVLGRAPGTLVKKSEFEARSLVRPY